MTHDEFENASPSTRRQFLAASSSSLLMAAFLAGCGGDDKSSTGGKSSTGKAIAASAVAGNFRWSIFSDSPPDRAIWQELARDVHSKYPKVSIKLETAGFNDYWDKLATQISTKSQPDIITMQSLRMPQFAARKAMIPLDDYIKRESNLNYEDFFPSGREGMSAGGKTFGLGYDIGPLVMYYNKDLLKKVGVPAPSASKPITWDEFRSACREITDAKHNQYGFVMQPSFDSTVPFIWSAGGDYMDKDAGKCTLDSEGAKAGIAFISDIFTKDKTGAPITDLANYQFGSERFFSGNVGMFIDGPWQIAALKANAKFDWDIAPVPAGPSGSITWAAGSGFAVSSAAKDPDSVWKSIVELTNTQSLTKVVKAGRGYAARASAAEAFKEQKAPPASPGVVDAILSGKAGSARPYKTTATWQEISVMLGRDFTPVFLGKQSVDETVAKVKPQFDQLLQRGQRLLERI